MSFDKRFKRHSNIINAGFWAITLFFIVVLGFVGFVIYEIIDLIGGMDWSHGLKGIVDAIWYGKESR